MAIKTIQNATQREKGQKTKTNKQTKKPTEHHRYVTICNQSPAGEERGRKGDHQQVLKK